MHRLLEPSSRPSQAPLQIPLRAPFSLPLLPHRALSLSVVVVCQVESLLTAALSEMETDLQGTYYPHGAMTKKVGTAARVC